MSKSKLLTEHDVIITMDDIINLKRVKNEHFNSSYDIKSPHDDYTIRVSHNKDRFKIFVRLENSPCGLYFYWDSDVKFWSLSTQHHATTLDEIKRLNEYAIAYSRRINNEIDVEPIVEIAEKNKPLYKFHSDTSNSDIQIIESVINELNTDYNKHESHKILFKYSKDDINTKIRMFEWSSKNDTLKLIGICSDRLQKSINLINGHNL